MEMKFLRLRSNIKKHIKSFNIFLSKNTSHFLLHPFYLHKHDNLNKNKFIEYLTIKVVLNGWAIVSLHSRFHTLEISNN